LTAADIACNTKINGISVTIGLRTVLQQKEDGIKGVRFLCLATILIMALTLPGVVYAAKPEAKPCATNVEIVKKIGAKGMPLMGPPSRGPKPHAATGIIGEEVSGTRYAIIIGISDYPGPDHVLEGGYDLSYADDDAMAMHNTLTTIYSFNPADIRLLVDSGASRDAILAEIANLKGSVSEGDEVVFFFSGHGAKYMPKSTLAQGGGKVGIVTWGWQAPEDPTDFYLEIIWDEELREAFSGFDTDRIIFIFDTCLAGGMIELGKKGRVICMATTQTGLAIEYGEDYVDYYNGGELPPINHGLFTYFFVELGMTDGGADFHPADGYVTVEEAFDFARFSLEEISIATEGLWQIPTIRDGLVKDLLL
jgi:hypothetical protein